MRDIEYNEFNDQHLDFLMQGGVVVLRNCSPIVNFRKYFVKLAASCVPEVEEKQLLALYENKKIDDISSLLAISRAGAIAWRELFMGRCLAPMFKQVRSLGEVLFHGGGLAKTTVSEDWLRQIKKDPRFAYEVYTLVSKVGNDPLFGKPELLKIHRDFNRPHSVFQLNLWFPMHGMREEETLPIWPTVYHSPVFDMDSTVENINRLPLPLSFHLNFGDCVLFHGEHLHGSPAVLTPTHFRHTYDIRFALSAYDDNSHYRDFFVNTKLFSIDNEFPKLKLVDKFIELRDGKPNITLLSRAFEFFSAIDYLDEPFFEILKKIDLLQEWGHSLQTKVAQHVVKHSTMPGQLYKFSLLLSKKSDKQVQCQLWNKTKKTAEGFVEKRFGPQKYKMHRTQMTLEEIGFAAERELRDLVVTP